MSYVTVYSPDGQKFEVASRDRADKLLLEDGWTQTPPEDEKPKKTSVRKKKKVEDDPVEETKASDFGSLFGDTAEEPRDES